MSWAARRFIPGKPVLRAVRHRKKILSAAESKALGTQIPSESELNEALIFAVDHKLWRWANIISMANGTRELLRKLDGLERDYDEMKNQSESWKGRYFQEKQKILALQQKIGSLRRSRQNSRTRMRAYP